MVPVPTYGGDVSEVQQEVYSAITQPGTQPVKPGQTVAVINQKGGQGKTTTACEMAVNLADRGVRVRVIDGDGQDGGLSALLAPQWQHVDPAQRWELADVLLDRCTLDQATWPTLVEGVDIVPSSEAVKQFGRMATDPGREWTLQEAIEASDRTYGVNLQDCPPNLGEVTLALLLAADTVIVPVKVGGLDFKGVRQLNKLLTKVRGSRLRPDQTTSAVLVTFRENNALTDQVVDQLIQDYPDALNAAVRKTIRVGEAGFADTPAARFAPSCTAVADYKEITGAVFAPVLEGTA